MTDSTVNVVQAKWLEKLPPLRLGASLLALSSLMALFFVPVAAVAYARHAVPGLEAAAVAGGVCWLGAALALGATALFARGGVNAPLYAFLFSMVFNFAMPLVVGTILSRTGGPLAEAGVFGMIVVFFEFALLVETLLLICLLKTLR